MSVREVQVHIVGAGLAGLSAAVTLARRNIRSSLISLLPSERSQSVLAEGGINGALNTMGEDDCPENHFADTMKAGGYIADPEAVRGLTEHAPEILLELKKLGVAFNLQHEQIQQRNFGGQKKKRTAYARSSTGKALMTALIDEARKYEAAGLISRYPHHELRDILLRDAECAGVLIRDTYSGELLQLEGPVILATGGMNGIFPSVTTGTVTNSGDAAALAFARGVRFSNLEMIQYHPTTIGIAGKRCLVSEAARGEGGRLFVLRDGQPWHFMEEKYPELGNLMPRDVVSREMYFVTHERLGASGKDPAPSEAEGTQVYLDMRHLSRDVWREKLPDLRLELLHYLQIDPAKTPIPVEPGIHYFMGGMDVDAQHRTSIRGLYAAGECCSQYHGANRLGGNSTMGAIYGGRVAANSVCAFLEEDTPDRTGTQIAGMDIREAASDPLPADEDRLSRQIRDILLPAMGIVREKKGLETALHQLQALKESRSWSFREENRLVLAQAMLQSALFRKESRGAHYRLDYPETLEAFRGKTTAQRRADTITVQLVPAQELELR